MRNDEKTLDIKTIILDINIDTLEIMNVKSGERKTIDSKIFDTCMIHKGDFYMTNESGAIPYGISRARREDIREYRREEAACGNI